MNKHPQSELTDEARQIIDKLKYKEAQNAYNIGQFYEARRMPGSAAVYYRDIIQNYPETEWAQKSQERLNEIEAK